MNDPGPLSGRPGGFLSGHKTLPGGPPLFRERRRARSLTGGDIRVGAIRGRTGAEMSDPLDVRRNLDHCMLTIKDAGEAMADDMHGAAMRLGAAAMMLASASHAVHRRAAELVPGQTPPDSGEAPAGA